MHETWSSPESSINVFLRWSHELEEGHDPEYEIEEGHHGDVANLAVSVEPQSLLHLFLLDLSLHVRLCVNFVPLPGSFRSKMSSVASQWKLSMSPVWVIWFPFRILSRGEKYIFKICRFPVCLGFDDGFYICVEHEREDHHVGTEQEPDINEFKVGSGGQCDLNTGDNRHYHQHQGEAHHHSVLQSRIW